jgi:hypothetical protein
MKRLLIISPWLADFGHGILITIILLTLFNIEPNVTYFLLGLAFSVLPDLDGIKEFSRYGNVDAGEHGDHRDGLHYPVVWLLVGGVFLYLDTFVGTLFILCVFAHFLNDSWGTGWGIEWLWPFSTRSYKFFSRNDVDADVTLQSLLTSWDPEAKNSTAKKYGNRNWLEHHYGHITLISGIEYGTFIIALFVVLVYLSA